MNATFYSVIASTCLMNRHCSTLNCQSDAVEAICNAQLDRLIR